MQLIDKFIEWWLSIGFAGKATIILFACGWVVLIYCMITAPRDPEEQEEPEHLGDEASIFTCVDQDGRLRKVGDRMRRVK